MDELNFSNGDKINLSKLRSGTNIDDKNIFLKKYDKNGNSIFDADELEELKADLKTASGDDKTMQENEALTLLSNKLNISLDEAKQILSKTGNMIAKGLFGLTNQQKGQEIGDILHDIIDDNFRISGGGYNMENYEELEKMEDAAQQPATYVWIVDAFFPFSSSQVL